MAAVNRAQARARRHIRVRRKVHGTASRPRLNVTRELALHDALRALIRAGKVKSAHDCSDGGAEGLRAFDLRDV